MRNDLYTLVMNSSEGITLKNIRIELGIEHPNHAFYHLKKLVEFKYLRKVDDIYYPTHVNFQKSFKGRIEDAIRAGATTQTEVAVMIHSYREKVWYHMKKHDMFRDLGG